MDGSRYVDLDSDLVEVTAKPLVTVRAVERFILNGQAVPKGARFDLEDEDASSLVKLGMVEVVPDGGSENSE